MRPDHVHADRRLGLQTRTSIRVPRRAGECVAASPALAVLWCRSVRRSPGLARRDRLGLAVVGVLEGLEELTVDERVRGFGEGPGDQDFGQRRCSLREAGRNGHGQSAIDLRRANLSAAGALWTPVGSLARMRELLTKPLLVVTGKGGVGKSTVAAALGLAAAARGRRTIVAEVAARDDVTRALGRRRRRRDRRARRSAPALHHISIDPESALEEYLARPAAARRWPTCWRLSRMFAYLAAATPGLRELLTVGKVWELAQPDRRTPGAQPYDLVILDAPATGHGVAVLDRAAGRSPSAARMGPSRARARIIHEMLADPEQTAIVAVATAEEMPVNETLALRDALRDELGQRFAARRRQRRAAARASRRADVRGAARPRARGGSRAVRAARRRGTRARAPSARQLARLRRAASPASSVRTLPFLRRREHDAPRRRRAGAPCGRASCVR